MAAELKLEIKPKIGNCLRTLFLENFEIKFFGKDELCQFNSNQSLSNKEIAGIQKEIKNNAA